MPQFPSFCHFCFHTLLLLWHLFVLFWSWTITIVFQLFSSVPLWLVSPHSLVCDMHRRQPWGERDCHIGKIQQIYTRGESIKPTTDHRDLRVWLSCRSWHDRQVLCKYCSIIALICVTPVWCVPCFPRYIFSDLNVKCISCMAQPVVHCLSHLRCCCCKFDRCGIRAKGGVRAT